MFDPRDFHAYAVESSTGAPDEAACRSAISRAYYAAYLVAHSYIIREQIHVRPRPGRRWGSHDRTIHAVGAIRNPGAARIKKELMKLKRHRVNADYRLDYMGARRDMPGAIRSAARIIAWIDALP